MVTRLMVRDLVSFDRVELSFDQGLVVFSGPSGAGKSVLISAILSAFGHNAGASASLCEVSLLKPDGLKSDAFVLEDEITVKSIKKEKLRYFVDAQSISKRALKEMFAPYVKYLSVRDQSGMQSEALLELIDTLLLEKKRSFKRLKREYRKRYANYRAKERELERMRQEERNAAQKAEFLRFEIEKISEIDPKPEEEESLMRIKRQLSRMDKLQEALNDASGIFAFEGRVEEVYRLLEKDATLFNEAMNRLRADFEESASLAEELESVEVEEVLDRLSALNELKRRYGSIEGAIMYKEEKERELASLLHIERDMAMLERFLESERFELLTIASQLSQDRKAESKSLESKLEAYLSGLKLPPLRFRFSQTSLSETGTDELTFVLGDLSPETLSGGEFNRVRLALMAASVPQTSSIRGVLILDEIDANVSGDESIAIAEMITVLSKGYQVFAISHQPHLSAKATQHILVRKDEKTSRATVLDEEGRIAEIARIIEGENPSEQALAFAKRLRR